MRIYWIISVLTVLCFNSLFAQNSLENYLKSVQENNKSLKAAKEELNARSLGYYTGISLDNPELEYGYFPGNTSAIGTKQVIGISQSFDVATISGNRKKMAELQSQQAKMEYIKTTQQVLGEARQTWLTQVYLNQIEDFYNTRVEEAEQLTSFYEKKMQNGDANQLDLNKARLFKIHWQNQLRLLSSEKEQNQLKLNRINGGVDFSVSEHQYPENKLNSWESFLDELKQKHIDYQLSQQAISGAQQEVKLSKQAGLPSFSLALESEMVLDDAYNGVKAGVSIPLWANKNNVKQAKAQQLLAEFQQEEMHLQLESTYKKQWQLTQALYTNASTLRKELTTMDNQKLLKKSLEMGQISAINYVQEISYFYDIHDELLKMELEFQLAYETLFRHLTPVN